MTRTETHVREALDNELDSGAVDRLTRLIADLGEPTPRTQRRGIQMLPAIAAVAVLAVVALVTAVVARWNAGSGGGSVGGDGVWTAPATWKAQWTFTVDGVAGYTTTRVSVLREGDDGLVTEGVTVTATDSPVTGVLVLLRGGSIGYPADLSGEQVSVNGRGGQFVPGTYVSQDGLVESVYREPWRAAQENHDHQPQLVWQYPDGSWARLTGTFGFEPASYDYDNAAAQSAMLEIARAVEAGGAEAVRVPFRVTSMPEGYQLDEAEFLDGVPCLVYSKDVAEPDGTVVSFPVGVCRVLTGVTDADTRRSAERSLPDSDNVVVRDLPDGTSILVTYPSFGDEFGKDDATRVANELDVSPDLNAPETWLDVR